MINPAALSHSTHRHQPDGLFCFPPHVIERLRITLPNKGRLSDRSRVLFTQAGLEVLVREERALTASPGGEFEAIFVRSSFSSPPSLTGFQGVAHRDAAAGTLTIGRWSPDPDINLCRRIPWLSLTAVLLSSRFGCRACPPRGCRSCPHLVGFFTGRGDRTSRHAHWSRSACGRHFRLLPVESCIRRASVRRHDTERTAGVAMQAGAARAGIAGTVIFVLVAWRNSAAAGQLTLP